MLESDNNLLAYDFDLPEELIAKHPLARSKSRLMHINRQTHAINHYQFSQLPDLLQKNDNLVLNNVKVRKVRFYGSTDQNKTHEIIFVTLPQDHDQGEFLALVSKRKKIKIDQILTLPQGRNIKYLGPENEYARFKALTWNDQKNLPFLYSEEYFDTHGVIPIPPYLRRKAEDRDNHEYQTVFAQKTGAAAAPTAALHFSDELLKKIQEHGIKIHFLTLYVGLGTFSPVRVQNILNHKMHEEKFEIPCRTLSILQKEAQKKNRIIAVGTTSLRVLESLSHIPAQDKEMKQGPNKKPIPFEGRDISNQVTSHNQKFPKNRGQVIWQINRQKLSGSTSIFISPGYQFQMTDALITNFHTPKSTLLMLISAFYQRKAILNAYQEAIAKKYRFFSYGDSMLLT